MTQETDDLVSHLLHIFADHSSRASIAARRKPRQKLGLCLRQFFTLDHCRGYLFDRKAIEPYILAARENRGIQPVGIRTRENNERIRMRLFQRFEECILRLLVHHITLAYDYHSPPAARV